MLRSDISELLSSQCRSTVGAQVGLEVDVPVIFGVITTDTIEQAIERSGTKAGNKGSEVAVAAIEMANIIDQLN